MVTETLQASQQMTLQAGPKTAQMDPMASRLTSPRILVVDDEDDVLRAISFRLKSAGFEVMRASDGACATELAVKEVPDLILLDIGMPCGDGHTVANRLRNNFATMGVPVVYLTCRTGEADRLKAKELGAAAYVTKPFTSQHLVDVVNAVLFGVIPMAEA